MTGEYAITPAGFPKPSEAAVPAVRLRTVFLASPDHFGRKPGRRQYLMLTPKEQETPGIALGSPRPSRDMSPYEGARPSVKQPPLSAGSLRFARWPLCLTALEGICLR